jgi:hypothetical protein
MRRRWAGTFADGVTNTSHILSIRFGDDIGFGFLNKDERGEKQELENEDEMRMKGEEKSTDDDTNSDHATAQLTLVSCLEWCEA